MKRVFYSVFPMITLICALVIVYILEDIFMSGILELFNFDGPHSINIFNVYIIVFLGLISIYILSRYIMEINERIFRVFTFVINFFGIITIICIVIIFRMMEWSV